MLRRMETRTDTTPRFAYPIPETAHLLGISTRSVYRLLASGDLRAVLICGRRRVPAVELERLTKPQAAAT